MYVSVYIYSCVRVHMYMYICRLTISEILYVVKCKYVLIFILTDF